MKNYFHMEFDEFEKYLLFFLYFVHFIETEVNKLRESNLFENLKN